MPTRISAHARYAIRAVLAAGLLAGGCRGAPSSTPVPVVDLIKEFARADRRPDTGYSVGEHVAAGTALPAIEAPAPGRLTWTLPMPRRGRFRAQLAAIGSPVRVRIGVSDARIYELLAEANVSADSAWTPIAADLSSYAGWKLSLFYRPERRLWRLNLSADAPAGVPATVAWGRAEILAGSGADALEYARRRARVIRNEAP